MKTMKPDRIKTLNQRACEIAGIDYEDMDTTDLRYALMDGIQQVLIEEDLVFARYAGGDPDMVGTTNGPQCEIYCDPRTNELVNLWIDGDTLGFDDQVETINTTIILTKDNLTNGQIRNCRKCPLALTINRYLKPEYFSTVFHGHYSIQHRDGYTPIGTGSFEMWGEAYLIVSAIDHGKEIVAPCKVKIPLPKDALRTLRQTPRILPLP